MKKPDNIQIYDENAKQLAARYESTQTEAALPAFTRIVKEYAGQDRNMLDIGCGSGRDAFWFANQGWNVDAADGSIALLDEARKLHTHQSLRYMHDLAPDFANIQKEEKRYSTILMSAFIFHFEKPDREKILRFCMNMMLPSGLIHITLRNGPIYPDRNIFSVNPKEIEAFAKNHGLESKHHGRTQDSMGMNNILWDNISIWRGNDWSHAKEILV